MARKFHRSAPNGKEHGSSGGSAQSVPNGKITVPFDFQPKFAGVCQQNKPRYQLNSDFIRWIALDSFQRRLYSPLTTMCGLLY